MISPVRLAGQVVFYVLAAAGTAYLAANPVYHQFPADKAQIKLSFAHGAARMEDCRRLTPKEIAKLPPGQRRPNTCSRERVPVHVQLSVNDETVYEATLEPTGLSRDGPARVYQKFAVPAGRHVIVARLRDSKRKQGFDYETQKSVDLTPWQNLSIDFKADAGGFIFR